LLYIAITLFNSLAIKKLLEEGLKTDHPNGVKNTVPLKFKDS